MRLKNAYDVVMVLVFPRVCDIHIGSQGGSREEHVYVQVLVATHCLIVVENLVKRANYVRKS